MPSFKDDFGGRKDAAANAKKTLLEKFRAKPAADDPAVLERQAARRAVSEARAARNAERKAAKLAAEAAEKAAREAAEKAEQERVARETAEKAANEAASLAARAAAQVKLLAEQKAARDARYAARKARK